MRFRIKNIIAFGSIVIIFNSNFIFPQTSECPQNVKYEGKTYSTVQIGDQCWLKENLDVGTMINGSQDQTNNNIIEKYCYENKIKNCNKYGGLYQWNEAMQYLINEGAKGICPSGWHIPKDAEFNILKAVVNNDSNALKEIGQGRGGGAGTNTNGFSALLAGSRDFNGTLGYLGNEANFWGSTVGNADIALDLSLFKSVSDIYLIYYGKNYGFSVRCLKD